MDHYFLGVSVPGSTSSLTLMKTKTAHRKHAHLFLHVSDVTA